MSSINLMSNNPFAPGTASSDRTAYVMDDLESGTKKPSVTIDEVPSKTRPPLGRRKTTNEEVKAALGGHKHHEDEDALTRVGAWIWKIHTSSIVSRYALYVLPVAALLAIPLILSDTVYRESKAWMLGPIRLLGLFIWIEIAWVSLWLCKLVAHALPVVFQAVSGVISTGVKKYTQIMSNLEIPISLFVWSIVNYTTSTVIITHFCEPDKKLMSDPKAENYVSEHQQCNPAWGDTVSKVFTAGIVATALVLAEKTFIQIIGVNYHRKQYGQKIKESKKLVWLLDMLYEASRTLFPEFCREFEAEDEEISGNTLEEVKLALGKAGVGTKVFSQAGRVGK